MLSSLLVIMLGFLLGLCCCWFVMTFLGMGSRALQVMKNRYQKLDDAFEDLEKFFQKQDQVARTERKGLLDQIKQQGQSIKQCQSDKKSLIADAQIAETDFMTRISKLENKLELLSADKASLEEKLIMQSRHLEKLVQEIEMAKSRGAVAQSSDAEMKMLQHSMSRLQEMMEEEGVEYRKQISQLAGQLEAALQNKPQFDDLTQISGVGKKLQELLNNIGVTSFQHIADATPEGIIEIKSILGSFSDRVERDDWINQAKKLMN